MKGYDKLTNIQKELFQEAYRVHFEDRLEVLFKRNNEFIKVGYDNGYWGYFYYILIEY